MIFVCLAVGIILPIPKLLVAALALVALLVARRLSKDPVALLIWIRALLQKARYLPTLRKVFQMRIEE